MIAIHWDNNQKHSAKWTHEWIRLCDSYNLDYELVDVYSPDFLSQASKFEILLWHFSQYSVKDQVFARNMLSAFKLSGLKVFPDYSEIFHFDDKIIQQMILDINNIASPQSRIYFSKEDALSSKNDYPCVVKLRNGSGSANVQLISSEADFLAYVNKAFGKGVDSSPSILYKLKSNLKSAKDIRTVIHRLLRTKDFIISKKESSLLPNEKGYVYTQEFIDNEGYDLKIVIVNKKMSFICRNIRCDDFRASGGGDLFYDKALITDKVIKLCRRASEIINSKCIGFDVVVDKQGEPFIIEFSYGFSHKAIMDAKGYFDQRDNWIDEPLNVPKEILWSLK